MSLPGTIIFDCKWRDAVEEEEGCCKVLCPLQFSFVDVWRLLLCCMNGTSGFDALGRPVRPFSFVNQFEQRAENLVWFLKTCHVLLALTTILAFLMLLAAHRKSYGIRLVDVLCSSFLPHFKAEMDPLNLMSALISRKAMRCCAN